MYALGIPQASIEYWGDAMAGNGDGWMTGLALDDFMFFFDDCLAGLPN